MNEIYNTLTIVTENKELGKRLNLIQSELNKVVKSANTIGKALCEIKEKELWTSDYKSFEECAGIFGIKKAQAYNLIKGYQVGEIKLFDGKMKISSVFSNTQCVELARLKNAKDEKAMIESIELSVIEPEMTTKQIRAIVDEIIHPDKVKAKEEPTDETTDEPTDETAEELTKIPKYITVTIENGELIIIDKIGLKQTDTDKLRTLLGKYI